MTSSINKRKRGGNIYEYFNNIYENFDVNNTIDNETINLSYDKYTNLLPGFTVSLYNNSHELNNNFNYYKDKTRIVSSFLETRTLGGVNNANDFTTLLSRYYNHITGIYVSIFDGYIFLNAHIDYHFLLLANNRSFLYIYDDTNKIIKYIDMNSRGFYWYGTTNTGDGQPIRFTKNTVCRITIISTSIRWFICEPQQINSSRNILGDNYTYDNGLDNRGLFTNFVFSTPNNNYEPLSIVKTNINIKPFYIFWWNYKDKNNDKIYYAFSNTNNNSYNYVKRKFSNISFIQKKQIGYYESNKNVFNFEYPSSDFNQNFEMYYFDIKRLSTDTIIYNVSYYKMVTYFVPYYHSYDIKDYIIIDFRLDAKYNKITDDKSIILTSVNLFIEEGTNDPIFSEKAITDITTKELFTNPAANIDIYLDFDKTKQLLLPIKQGVIIPKPDPTVYKNKYKEGYRLVFYIYEESQEDLKKPSNVIYLDHDYIDYFESLFNATTGSFINKIIKDIQFIKYNDLEPIPLYVYKYKYKGGTNDITYYNFKPINQINGEEIIDNNFPSYYDKGDFVLETSDDKKTHIGYYNKNDNKIFFDSLNTYPDLRNQTTDLLLTDFTFEILNTFTNVKTDNVTYNNLELKKKYNIITKIYYKYIKVYEKDLNVYIYKYDLDDKNIKKSVTVFQNKNDLYFSSVDYNKNILNKIISKSNKIGVFDDPEKIQQFNYQLSKQLDSAYNNFLFKIIGKINDILYHLFVDSNIETNINLLTNNSPNSFRITDILFEKYIQPQDIIFYSYKYSKSSSQESDYDLFFIDLKEKNNQETLDNIKFYYNNEDFSYKDNNYKYIILPNIKCYISDGENFYNGNYPDPYYYDKKNYRCYIHDIFINDFVKNNGNKKEFQLFANSNDNTLHTDINDLLVYKFRYVIRTLFYKETVSNVNSIFDSMDFDIYKKHLNPEEIKNLKKGNNVEKKEDLVQVNRYKYKKDGKNIYTFEETYKLGISNKKFDNVLNKDDDKVLVGYSLKSDYDIYIRDISHKRDLIIKNFTNISNEYFYVYRIKNLSTDVVFDTIYIDQYLPPSVGDANHIFYNYRIIKIDYTNVIPPTVPIYRYVYKYVKNGDNNQTDIYYTFKYLDDDNLKDVNNGYYGSMTGYNFTNLDDPELQIVGYVYGNVNVAESTGLPVLEKKTIIYNDNNINVIDNRELRLTEKEAVEKPKPLPPQPTQSKSVINYKKPIYIYLKNNNNYEQIIIDNYPNNDPYKIIYNHFTSISSDNIFNSGDANYSGFIFHIENNPDPIKPYKCTVTYNTKTLYISDYPIYNINTTDKYIEYINNGGIIFISDIKGFISVINDYLKSEGHVNIALNTFLSVDLYLYQIDGFIAYFDYNYSRNYIKLTDNDTKYKIYRYNPNYKEKFTNYIEEFTIIEENKKITKVIYKGELFSPPDIDETNKLYKYTYIKYDDENRIPIYNDDGYDAFDNEDKLNYILTNIDYDGLRGDLKTSLTIYDADEFYIYKLYIKIGNELTSKLVINYSNDKASTYINDNVVKAVPIGKTKRGYIKYRNLATIGNYYDITDNGYLNKIYDDNKVNYYRDYMNKRYKFILQSSRNDKPILVFDCNNTNNLKINLKSIDGEYYITNVLYEDYINKPCYNYVVYDEYLEKYNICETNNKVLLFTLYNNCVIDRYLYNPTICLDPIKQDFIITDDGTYYLPSIYNVLRFNIEKYITMSFIDKLYDPDSDNKYLNTIIEYNKLFIKKEEIPMFINIMKILRYIFDKLYNLFFDNDNYSDVSSKSISDSYDNNFDNYYQNIFNSLEFIYENNDEETLSIGDLKGLIIINLKNAGISKEVFDNLFNPNGNFIMDSNTIFKPVSTIESSNTAVNINNYNNLISIKTIITKKDVEIPFSDNISDSNINYFLSKINTEPLNNGLKPSNCNIKWFFYNNVYNIFHMRSYNAKSQYYFFKTFYYIILNNTLVLEKFYKNYCILNGVSNIDPTTQPDLNNISKFDINDIIIPLNNEIDPNIINLYTKNIGNNKKEYIENTYDLERLKIISLNKATNLNSNNNLYESKYKYNNNIKKHVYYLYILLLIVFIGIIYILLYNNNDNLRVKITNLSILLTILIIIVIIIVLYYKNDMLVVENFKSHGLQKNKNDYLSASNQMIYDLNNYNYTNQKYLNVINKKILYIFTRDILNKSNDGLNFKIKDNNSKISKYIKQKQEIVNSQNVLFGNLLYNYYFIVSLCLIISLGIISYMLVVLYPQYIKSILIISIIIILLILAYCYIKLTERTHVKYNKKYWRKPDTNKLDSNHEFKPSTSIFNFYSNLQSI